MARYIRASLVFLLPMMATGCGGWTHPTKSSNEFAQDDAICRQQAIEKVQASHQKQEMPTWLTKVTGTKSYSVDGNDTTRDQWHKSCLRVMGWASGSTPSVPNVVSTELITSGLLGSGLGSGLSSSILGSSLSSGLLSSGLQLLGR